MEQTVMVLDGNQRSALAVVRSLGEKKIPVVVGEETVRSLAAASRFCGRRFVYPSAYDRPKEFLQEVSRQLQRFPGAVLMPMTDVTLSEVLKNRKLLPPETRLPFPGWETYRELSDKVSLFRRAVRAGVPVPATLFSSDFGSASRLSAEASRLGFPLVLKPAFSRMKSGGRWVGTTVRYAATRHELERLLATEPFRSGPFLVQEKIEGPGLGVFLLLEQDGTVARFAHERIREKPPSGGVSVLCRSIELPETTVEASAGLLRGAGWTGVAMVEFKLDARSNIPRLMEVNARFWGSLQLAISAGVDFPFLLYRHALGERPSPPPAYRVGVASRWELGDLDHLLIRLRRRPGLQLPLHAPPLSRAVLHFLADFFRPAVRHEVFRPNDPAPFVAELQQYVQKLVCPPERRS